MHRAQRWLRGARSLSRVVRVTRRYVRRARFDAPEARAAVDYREAKAQRWASELLGALGVGVEQAGAAPRTPALYVANHRSYLDIVALLSAVPGRFVAKRELTRWPLFGRAAALGGSIFVDRADRADRRRVRARIGEALTAGQSIIVFPEGTTYATEMGPFRRGAFEVAADAGVPVVPVAIEYPAADLAWVGDDDFVGHFLRTVGRGGIRVGLSVGAPIRDLDPARSLTASRRFIAATLPTLRHQLRTQHRDRPGGPAH